MTQFKVRYALVPPFPLKWEHFLPRFFFVFLLSFLHLVTLLVVLVSSHPFSSSFSSSSSFSFKAEADSFSPLSTWHVRWEWGETKKARGRDWDSPPLSSKHFYVGGHFFSLPCKASKILYYFFDILPPKSTTIPQYMYENLATSPLSQHLGCSVRHWKHIPVL